MNHMKKSREAFFTYLKIRTNLRKKMSPEKTQPRDIQVIGSPEVLFFNHRIVLSIYSLV